MTPRLMVGSLQWTILPLMRRGTSEKAQIVEGKSSSGCVELEACVYYPSRNVRGVGRGRGMVFRREYWTGAANWSCQ